MNEMDRRNFLKTAAGASLALVAAATAAPAQDDNLAAPEKKFRGVNLGGWLVLERWITPTLYHGVDAEDEFTLCQKLGKDKATERLKKHRETWITADDFKWLAAHGINTVRLPVGYAVLEENPPYISGADTLAWAFQTAKENNLRVLLDLHGVPGSQNGWDHSGKSGEIGWPKSQENIDHSLRIVEGLAEFCKNYDNLLGIELLNEPRVEIPIEILEKYYRNAYDRVRAHIPPERGSVIFHDGFRQTAWARYMQEPDCKNVILDTHMYQCFNDEDKKRELHAQIDWALIQRQKQLDRIRETHRCIVGEWSCSLPPIAMRGLRDLSLDAAMRAYGAAQLLTYGTTEGWFFWTYRTEAEGAWNFRSCVERGWLPSRYDS